MATRDLDPKQVIVTFGEVELSGFADGTYVSIERDEDAWTKHVGADGEVGRIRNRNRCAGVTVTLAEYSPANDLLMAYALADERDGSGKKPITVKDLLGTTIAHAPVAWVKKLPVVEKAKEVTDREWVFDTGPMDIFAGGNA